MARPLKGFNLELIEDLASIHCSNTEIAAVVGCDSSLLSKKGYSEVIAKGKERGKRTLRRKMFDTAMGGNVVMQIWLSKQYLGMTDKIEEKIETNQNSTVTLKWSDEDEQDRTPDAKADLATKADQ